MIEASLELGLHFGHSIFNFLNGIESTLRSFSQSQWSNTLEPKLHILWKRSVSDKNMIN